MSLRQNALLLILLTGLTAILGQWSADFVRWWCLPAAALLLGLAYEVAVLSRVRLELELRTAEHWLLGRSQQIEFAFRQSSPRTLAIQTALSAPSGFALESRIATLELPPDLPAAARGSRCVTRARIRWAQRAPSESRACEASSAGTRIRSAASGRAASARRCAIPARGARG